MVISPSACTATAKMKNSFSEVVEFCGPIDREQREGFPLYAAKLEGRELS